MARTLSSPFLCLLISVRLELIDPPSSIFITKRCCFFPVNTGTFMIFNPCLINPTVSVGKSIKSRLWIGLYYLRPVSNRSLMIS